MQRNLIKIFHLTKMYFIQGRNVGKQISEGIKKPSRPLLLFMLSNEMKAFVHSVKLFKTWNDSILFCSDLFLSFSFPFTPQQSIGFYFFLSFSKCIPDINALGIGLRNDKTVFLIGMSSCFSLFSLLFIHLSMPLHFPLYFQVILIPSDYFPHLNIL